jgi:hypothetical protein
VPIHGSLKLVDTVKKLIVVILDMVILDTVTRNIINRITDLQDMMAAYAIAVASELVVNGGVAAFVKY